MRRNKILSLLFIMLLSCAVFASFFMEKANSYAGVEQTEIAESGTVEIDSLESIKNVSGNYILTKDCKFVSLDFEFKGTLDGNGHSILTKSENLVVETEVKAPLFPSLVGATIKNLNIQKLRLNLDSEGAYAGNNIGIISGTAVNSSITNIKMVGCKIIKSSLTSDTNVGFVCGKMTTSCNIKDVIVSDCSYELGIGETVSTKFNIGCVVGQAEDIVMANVIVNMYNKSTDGYKSITITSASKKDVYFGGLIGELLPSSDDFYRLFNNVVIMFENIFNLETESLIDYYRGSLIGKAGYISTEPYIKGFLTTYSNLFGSSENEISNLSELRIVLDYDYDVLNIAYFKTASNWNVAPGYEWNFKTTWMTKPNSKLPELQILSSFDVSFNPADVRIDVEKHPTEALILGGISNGNEPYYQADANDESTKVGLGGSVFIFAKISEENYYNKFFKIVGLWYDGNLIYDNEKENNNVADGFSIDFTLTENDEYIYQVKNFNANMSGEYFIEVKAVSYYIDVVVYNVGTEENPIYPGGVRSKTDSNLLTNSKIKMKYGDVITLTSVASFNKDYSDVTHWYLYNDNATDTHGQKIVFNPELLIENYKNYSISWEFTEDCKLFKNNTGAEIFNMDLFGGENEPEYQFVVIFEKSVKEIEIELKFETNEVINKKIASISIDNNPERITWNEERGCYVAKINYSAETEHTIKLIGVETGYEFDSWQYGLGKLSSGDDDFSGVFEIPASIEEDNDTDIMKIYCVFKENADDFGGGLLWLWISLGGVAFVGALTIIIVAIRRRGGGVGNSGANTKRYYY